jgi:hypothetical protein
MNQVASSALSETSVDLQETTEDRSPLKMFISRNHLRATTCNLNLWVIIFCEWIKLTADSTHNRLHDRFVAER